MRMGQGEDFLLEGLPAIYYNQKYLVFSPYIKKITALTDSEIRKRETLDKLKKLGFFGKPKTNISNEKIATITLGLTGDCNLRCRYCYGNYGPIKRTYMSKELAIKILKSIIKKEVEEVRVTFYGGEPTLNMSTLKASVEYLTKLSLKKLHFHISTNGVTSKENLKYLIKNNFTFNVSYDGTPKFQNFQRPLLNNKPTSKFVERTIKYLVKNNARFKVKCVVTKYNVDNMASAVLYLSKLSVKYLHFEKVSYYGRAVDEGVKEPEPEEFVDNFFKAWDIARKLGIKLINSSYTNLFSPSTFYCTHIAGEALMVGPNRIISNCYEHLDDKETPFFLGRFDSGIKINTRNRDYIINNYNVDKMEKCKNCPIKYICGGGCPQQNYIKTGKLFVPDEKECWIKKQIVRGLIIRMYENKK